MRNLSSDNSKWLELNTLIYRLHRAGGESWVVLPDTESTPSTGAVGAQAALTRQGWHTGTARPGFPSPGRFLRLTPALTTCPKLLGWQTKGLGEMRGPNLRSHLHKDSCWVCTVANSEFPQLNATSSIKWMGKKHENHIKSNRIKSNGISSAYFYDTQKWTLQH